jgi:hypothetical protein
VLRDRRYPTVCVLNGLLMTYGAILTVGLPLWIVRRTHARCRQRLGPLAAKRPGCWSKRWAASVQRQVGGKPPRFSVPRRLLACSAMRAVLPMSS